MAGFQPNGAGGLSRNQLLRAADACERAAKAEDVQQERAAVLEVIAHKHAIEVGLMLTQMRGLSQTPHQQERLPLRESGDDIGYVESRIPKKVFMHLAMQKNFGMAGLGDDGEMKKFLKANPAFAVKTISGKTTVGWTGPARRTRRVNFARGTLVLAK